MVAALLSVLLSLDHLFRHDFDDGTLEQLVLQPQPLFLLVLAKTLAHWVLTGLPLVLLAPILGVMVHLDGNSIAVLCLTLLIGTPVLSLIGSIGAALTLGLRSAGVLLSLLIIPLYIPVLIFGTGTVAAATEGAPVGAYVPDGGVSGPGDNTGTICSRGSAENQPVEQLGIIDDV